MLTKMRLQNFKSWRDTGEINFAPITGFFGPNSSGKTSLLQALLLWKQTVESNDQNNILYTGDDNSYVNLGAFEKLVHQHSKDKTLQFSVDWHPENYIGKRIGGLQRSVREPIPVPPFRYEAEIQLVNNLVTLKNYHFLFKGTENLESEHYYWYDFGLRRNNTTNQYESFVRENSKEWIAFPNDIIKPRSVWNYRVQLQEDAVTDYPEIFFMLGYSQIFGQFVYLLDNINYLGPLRDHPKRFYVWSGDIPQDVGKSGEWTVAALLASQLHGGEHGTVPNDVEMNVAHWLKKLGLVHQFRLAPIAEGRREHEVLVQMTPEATEVALADVGFGVSQVLPVLTLCYYVPAGSILILEQPEIHLHPKIQAGLADLFITVAKERNLQIILESHSEHLLRRLQRRVAEEVMPHEDVTLYFTEMVGSASQLTPLELDTYGNIRNWPENFFGDELGDMGAMLEASLARQAEANGR